MHAICAEAARPAVTEAVTIGVQRAFDAAGWASVREFVLSSGRRADVLALGPKGEIAIVEVKSCEADFRADAKWPDYSEYCERFYFATAPDAPLSLFPADIGLIVADRFGGEIVRPAVETRLAPARRKALTLAFGRIAARRLLSASPV